MKEVALTQGYVALVDDEDYERVCQKKWQALKIRHSPGLVYGITSHYLGGGKYKTILLHRFILGMTGNTTCDHKKQ